jgi:hypothetical protein
MLFRGMSPKAAIRETVLSAVSGLIEHTSPVHSL